ncbi:MAG: response regulator transcription factor [Rhodospirillales bacterium]|nr:response regulator transcription factor [Alphaproteobacteria bacterium]MCB9986869.1 response regulator transcription factor [Rhodospirillales bacterium]USO08370.1 MAG: response regulator transcription factor [Rhodospirillales bacterium]
MSPQKAVVLSVDDDKNLQFVLREYLEGDGYRVLGAGSGRELEERLKGDPFDVVLLDLMLPDSQGLGLIGRIRAVSQAPIIIVSGKSDTTEKIVGLEMGADDYITKPFEMRELSARIRAVLRRSHETPAPAAAGANNVKGDDVIRFAKWKLDRTQYQAYDSAGHSLNLTTGEFRLLEALAVSANRALSREHLFDLTRDGKFDAYDRAIDIQIARIRKKLDDDPKSPDLIKTVRGVGYMLCDEPLKG